MRPGLHIDAIEDVEVLGPDDDYDALVDECDGFLPSVSRALLSERMRIFLSESPTPSSRRRPDRSAA